MQQVGHCLACGQPGSSLSIPSPSPLGLVPEHRARSKPKVPLICHPQKRRFHIFQPPNSRYSSSFHVIAPSVSLFGNRTVINLFSGLNLRMKGKEEKMLRQCVVPNNVNLVPDWKLVTLQVEKKYVPQRSIQKEWQQQN